MACLCNAAQLLQASKTQPQSVLSRLDTNFATSSRSCPASPSQFQSKQFLRPCVSGHSLHVRGDLKQCCSSADGATISAGPAIGNGQQRLLWDSVDKALLRIGSLGVQPTHQRSLSELIEAHKLIKVQVNSAEVDLAADLLMQQEGIQLLERKGRTLLFGPVGVSLSTLQAHAIDNTAAQDMQRSNRQQGGMPLLAKSVSKRLETLIAADLIQQQDFDVLSLRTLAKLPEPQALGLLQQVNEVSMRKVKNKSAWLMSQCRRRLGSQT